MKKLILALALSGCAMPSQQSAVPLTPEQQAAITANNAEIDNANAERERECLAREVIELQYLQNRRAITPLPVFNSPPVIQVQPVQPLNQYLQ